ncbi:coq1 putative hexaprenyl diphosphate synthase [Rhizophlyctis rosea]|uniref:Coq1 putative hexaprenyl diphosphate synthase n=1 Tax=Rhizophlyctis rosea TaxID=64517 RepID=A0AAD5SKE5_9FUNG|nr:coq1 putative hexaprenyl diphosphate synthase [Rhizophlyctis rosea]
MWRNAVKGGRLHDVTSNTVTITGKNLFKHKALPPTSSALQTPNFQSCRSASSAVAEKQPEASGWFAEGYTSLKSQIFGSASKLQPEKPPVKNWTEAVASAESLVHPTGGSVINPRELLGNDLKVLTENIRKLLGSGHPVLNTISNYYFQQQGKHIRPLIVLLMSQATSLAPKQGDGRWTLDEGVNAPISSGGGIHFDGTGGVGHGSKKEGASRLTDEEAMSDLVSTDSAPAILPTQKRLAEITEMIHTASLLHDDVIDVSDVRRAQASANAEFGNKMAILAGDFLLARASIALARLRNVEVVELLATVISNLVEGEFMQLRNSAIDNGDKGWLANVLGTRASRNDEVNARFEYYMEKTYLKTASLIAKSCRAAAVLGGCTADVAEAAYNYGKNLGLAFQLVDDMLDFVVTADEFGKPVNADLKLGLATAPVLYAAEKYPQLFPLMERKFEGKGDVEEALKYVFESDGIPMTKALAISYCQEAVRSISHLPDSPAKTALIQLTNSVITRKK